MTKFVPLIERCDFLVAESSVSKVGAHTENVPLSVRW